MKLKQFNYSDKDTPYQLVYNVGDGEVVKLNKLHLPEDVTGAYSTMVTHVREFLKENEDNFGYLCITANVKENETLLNFEYLKGFHNQRYQQVIKVKKVAIWDVSKQELQDFKADCDDQGRQEDYNSYWRLAQINKAWKDLQQACISNYDAIAEIDNSEQLNLDFNNDGDNEEIPEVDFEETLEDTDSQAQGE